MADLGISGQWKLYKSENMDGYLAELGVNYFARKAASLASSSLEIKQDGSKFWVKSTTMGFFVSENTFILNEEVETITMKQTLKETATIEGDTLVTRSIPVGSKQIKAKEIIVERRLVGDELHVVIKCGPEVAKRYFKRV